MATPDTQERILDTAEELFARDGYDATSLRAVTREAGVNLAAVHYHFGGKIPLFRAVIERRVGDINRERLELLDAAEARVEGAALPVEEILQAFLAPAFHRVGGDDEGFQCFMRIVGRLTSATGEQVRAIVPVFQPVVERFIPAFQRALPRLRREDVEWRFHFLLGSMSMYLVDPLRLHFATEGRCRSEDSAEALRQLVAHAAGAFAAEPVSGPPTRPTGAPEASESVPGGER